MFILLLATQVSLHPPFSSSLGLLLWIPLRELEDFLVFPDDFSAYPTLLDGILKITFTKVTYGRKKTELENSSFQ